MELNSAPKTTLPSGSQTTQQSTSTSSAENNASAKPVIGNPAGAVTVSPETASAPAERRQDRLGKQQDEAVTAQQAIESLRLTNRRTQLAFNAELNTVFVQIIDTRTEEVVETIPSEELVRQLKLKADAPTSQAAGRTGGGVVVDESV